MPGRRSARGERPARGVASGVAKGLSHTTAAERALRCPGSADERTGGPLAARAVQFPDRVARVEPAHSRCRRRPARCRYWSRHCGRRGAAASAVSEIVGLDAVDRYGRGRVAVLDDGHGRATGGQVASSPVRSRSQATQPQVPHIPITSPLVPFVSCRPAGGSSSVEAPTRDGRRVLDLTA